VICGHRGSKLGRIATGEDYKSKAIIIRNYCRLDRVQVLLKGISLEKATLSFYFTIIASRWVFGRSLSSMPLRKGYQCTAGPERDYPNNN
jgi:hypothetical protein